MATPKSKGSGGEKAALPKQNSNGQFTVAQRRTRAAFVRRNLPFSIFVFFPRLLVLLVLAAEVEVEAGLAARLAAEAIWLSSTSKVGQLVPVAPLMC